MDDTQEIKDYIIDRLPDFEGTHTSDIHFNLFNTDPWIIGRYDAEQWLIKSDRGVFGTIQFVIEYEKDNFGELNTDFSEPENVATMYAYILGEEIINELEIDTDEILTKELINSILEKLQVKSDKADKPIFNSNLI